MKFRVTVKQDLTACDTFQEDGDGPLNRELWTETFNTLEEALAYYNRQKSSQRYFGVAGQYVCYPEEI
jgi:hypothetical protein